MADFGRWVTAAEPALKIPDGAFLQAYAASRQQAAEQSLDGDPIAVAIRALTLPWEGTAAELLSRIAPIGRAPEAGLRHLADCPAHFGGSRPSSGSRPSTSRPLVRLARAAGGSSRSPREKTPVRHRRNRRNRRKARIHWAFLRRKVASQTDRRRHLRRKKMPIFATVATIASMATVENPPLWKMVNHGLCADGGSAAGG